MTYIAPASRVIKSSARASPILPLETWIKLGIGPRRSSSVCILTAALVERKFAHGNSERHKSIVVLSRAYTVLTRSIPISSAIYSLRARLIRAAARVDQIRQSRSSFASAKVDLATGPRSPRPYNFEDCD